MTTPNPHRLTGSDNARNVLADRIADGRAKIQETATRGVAAPTDLSGLRVWIVARRNTRPRTDHSPKATRTMNPPHDRSAVAPCSAEPEGSPWALRSPQC
jgi:hypothetical protein